MASSACRTKNHYLHVSDAMRAADRYTKRYGMKHRFYECDECGEYHLSTLIEGRKVMSLEALRSGAGAGEPTLPPTLD